MRAFGAISIFAGIQLGEVHLDRVVPERVIERGADDLGARRHLGIRGRIEFDLIEMTGRIRHAEARLQAGRLASADLPAVERDRLEPIGPADELGRRERPAADSIDEPARVGHLVDRVDVLRPNVVPYSRLRERVDDEVVAVRILDRRNLRCVQRHVVVDRNRIVGIKRRATATTAAGPPATARGAAPDTRRRTSAG